MMNKKKVFIPILLGVSLVLAGCSSSGLKIKYDDSELNEPWVEYHVPATKLSVAKGEEKLHLIKDDTDRGSYQYHVSIEPKLASNKALAYSVEDVNIASITDEGVVTAVGPGRTYVNISNNDPLTKASPLHLELYVDVKALDFTISPMGTAAAPLELDFYESISFTPTFTPSDSTERDIQWSIVDTTVENLAQIDADTGYLTANAVAGSGVVRAYHEILDKEIRIPFVVTNIVNRVDLTIPETQIDLNKIMTITGTPKNGETEVAPALHGEVTYHIVEDEEEPAHANIDEVTGELRPLSAGEVKVYAECRGVRSEVKTITIFEVKATHMEFSKPNVELSNDGEEQLVLNYDTDHAGYSKPSIENVTYVSSNPAVASISDSGVVKALAKGTTTITATIMGKEGELTAECTVNVTIVAKSITLTGGSSVYIQTPQHPEDVLTFSVKTLPAGLTDETVTYEFNKPGIAEIVESSNTSVTIKGIAAGDVLLVARCGSVTDSKPITVTERPVYFEGASNYYIVGNADYSSGTSISGVESWGSAKHAFHFTHETGNREYEIIEEYEGIITFHVGDQWKIRDGSEGDGAWKNLYEKEEGQAPNWHYEQSGSLTNGEMTCDSSASGNITVNKTGTYHVYYKNYQSGWYGVYVTSLKLSDASKTMGPNVTTTITASGWGGDTLTIENTDPTVATVNGSTSGTQTTTNGTITIKSVAEGTTTIRVSDDYFTRECVITVDEDISGIEKTIYLNAYGLFDQDGAIGFIHAYGEGMTDRDAKLTKVSGQDIIYSVAVPEETQNAIFVRMPSTATAIDWDNNWGQTPDELAPFGENNMFTMTGWSDSKIDGYWSTYDSSEHYTYPADAYLIGSINGWHEKDENFRMEKVAEGHYKIEGVELETNDEIKIFAKVGTDVYYYYGVGSVYANCHYTLGPTTDERGYNAIISETNTYTVELYIDSTSLDNHNFITLTPESGGGGGGGSSAPTPTSGTATVQGTYISIVDETDKIASYGNNIVAHMWNVTFDPSCGFSDYAGMEASGATFGDGVTFNNCINAVMTWKTDDPHKTYELIVPWYITSFDVCFLNQNGAFIKTQDSGSDAYQFSAIRNNQYAVYVWADDGSYQAWQDGSDWRVRGMSHGTTAGYTYTEHTYEVVLYTETEGAGTFTGADMYKAYEKATITATANTGYTFTGWSDSVITASRVVIVTAPIVYTAVFTNP